MAEPAISQAGEKRPALHKLIDELPVEELDLVEQLLARLEMDRLWKDVTDGFTGDWEKGKYARLDEIILEARSVRMAELDAKRLADSVDASWWQGNKGRILARIANAEA